MPRKQSKTQAHQRRGMHAQYISEWLKWYEDGVDVNAWAASHKRDQIQYIHRYFDRFDVIAAENLRMWLSEVDRNRVTLRRHMHGAVSSFARFLCERKGLITEAEREEIRRLYPKVPRGFKRKQKIIQQEDMPVIFRAAEKAADDDAYKRVLFKTLLIVMSTTALRLSEVCGLQFSNLRFHEDVTKASMTVVGKGNKERTLPFPKLAQQAILEYLKIRPQPSQQNELAPDALFWVYSQRYGCTTLKKYALVTYMREISEASGIAFTAHSFRHYRITQWMNDSRINPVHAQLWAGHTDLKTTQGYTHIRDKDALASAFLAGCEDLEVNPSVGNNPAQALPTSGDALELLLAALSNLSPQQKAQLIAKMVGA
jgi:integrase/recombinase XerC